MTKDILINISGLQMDVDPNDPIEMMTTGAYYLRNGKHYILYDELSEDNEIVKNVIKIGPKSVELTRKGGQSSHMVFEEGKENLSYYDTPFGSLLMGVNTSNIDWMEEEELSYEDKKHLFVYAGQTVNTFKYEHDQVEFFTHSPFSDSDSTADDVYRNEDALVFQVRFKAPVPVNLMAFGDSKWDAIDTIVQRSKDKNNTDRLKWDLLNIPHHCSYECLHADKEDEARKDERITVPTMLIKELLEEHSSWYAHLVSSSWPIRDDEEAYAQIQPPHIQAQKGYKDSIGSDVRFWVTMAYPNEDKPEPLEFEVGTFGLTKKKATRRSAAISTAAYAGATANPRSGTLDE